MTNITKRASGVGLVVLSLLLLFRESRTAQTNQKDAANFRTKRADLSKEIRRVEESVARLQMDEGRLKAQLDRSLGRERLANAQQRAREYERTKPLHAWVEVKNARLYQRLGLSPEMERSFEDLQAAHWLRLGDIDSTAQASGLSPNDAAISLLKKQENDQFRQDENSLLGPANFQIANDYERTEMPRAIADGLAGNVFDSVTPLSAEQSEQLTRILADNSPSYRNGGRATTTDMNLQSATAEAQAILSPAQMDALKNYFTGVQTFRTLLPLIQSASGPPK